MKIIGSTAIKHWFPDFKREPKDLDIIVNDNIEYLNNKKNGIEFLYNPIIESKGIEIEYLSPDELLTLKVSHIFWDISWDKHMFDIQFLLAKGCKLQKDLFYSLYEFWKSYHPKLVRSNLAMSAKDFFNNAITCEYNHDFLHTLINPIPVYTKILEDNEEVLVSEKKFELLSFDEKCDLVREEVMVMSWERYYNIDYRSAYLKMLKKFIMNHAPLWEALFIIENYILLHKPQYNYFKTIEQQIK